MIQDPAGLLQRIPELKPLCEDPGVLRAVEQGDPFRLYRALRWARWLGRLRSHRETIDALLSHRRLFARPLKGNPWLGTVNGFGVTLLGGAEPDPHDGTHIATHYVVALFAVPLLPLGAYVVRPSDGSTAFSRSWALFARVPLGPVSWLWSRTLALGVMALVAFGAAQTFRDSRYQEVPPYDTDWKAEATTRAIWLALDKTPQEALRIAQTAVQARPEDVELHRIYHWVAERTGHQKEVLEEYRSRAQAKPDSATAQYLYARLLRGREGQAAIEQLAQRFPQDPEILKSVTYTRWRLGDWKGALQTSETLRNLNAQEAAKTAETEALALVALGRRGEALKLLKKSFAEEEPDDRSRTAELYARIALGAKGVIPDELIAQLETSNPEEESSRRWDLRARAGLSTEGGPDWPGLRLMSTVGRDPQAAVALAAQLKSSDYHLLSKGGWALAYGEAVRTGAAEPEKALAQAYLLDTASLELFRRFVRGEAVSLEDADLTPEMLAAACFVRSRNAALPAQERRQLVEQARRDDGVHSAVSEAMATWAP
jgi:hypothetical protein